jgi:hypothetical protein
MTTKRKNPAETDLRTEQDRRQGSDRRKAERRANDAPVAIERRSGADRRKAGPDAERRKVERRINEYVLEPEVLEFINAVNSFKSVQQKPFPTWSEIFEIFLSLGYRKTE